MTKNELINVISDKTGCTKKDAASAVEATFSAILDALKNGEKVALTGFGTFEIRERAERNCINPRTKEQTVCPACKAPAFKPGKTLREAVNK